jgi:hypothetical protein
MEINNQNRTFSSRLLSRVSEVRSTYISRSRVCRTRSAGVLGLDLNKAFIFAPSISLSDAAAAAATVAAGAEDESLCDCLWLTADDAEALRAAVELPPDKQPPIFDRFQISHY